MTDNTTTVTGPMPVDRTRLVRTVLAAAAVLVPIAALLVTAAVLGPVLGPVIAIHWGLDGTADGFASTWGAFWVVLGLATVATALAIGFVIAGRRGRSSRAAAAISADVAGLFSAVWVSTAIATSEASSPEAASLGWSLVCVVVGLAWGVVVYLLATGSGARTPEPATAAPDATVTPVALRPGELLAWSRSTGSLAFSLLGALIAVLAIVGMILAAVSDRPLPSVIAPVILVLAALLVVALGRVRLSVDRRGIRLVSVVFGIPLLRIPLSDVAGVSVETIDPLAWGGWGLRFSSRGTAYVTRRRTGLVVTRRSGRAAAVTIDDAASAASVAAALTAPWSNN